MPTTLAPPTSLRAAVRREPPADWHAGWSHLAKDARYHEIVAGTLGTQFECRYLVLTDDAGETRAVQPFFLVDQDVVTASSPALRGLAAAARAVAPRFGRLRTLMVGCAAGEGHLGVEDEGEHRAVVCAMRDALPGIARSHGARLIVWKDFPASYRDACRPLLHDGYLRLPSMPATRVALRWANYEAYLADHLSRATRKNLRRKYRSAARQAPRLTLEVRTEPGAAVAEIHRLYAQVLDRSRLRFEELTPAFFQALGEAMPDRVRFFLWRDEGRLVACNVCLLHGDTLYDEYVGLEYEVALPWHLYFVTLRDVFSWAIAEGVKWYCSTPLNYDPKLHLGFELAPLDLYVRPTSPGLRGLARRILPLLGPTRGEPLLARFPNAAEL